MTTQCLVYICDKPEFVKEAGRSARSWLEEVSTTTDIFLYSPLSINYRNLQPFDYIEKLPKRRHNFFYLDRLEWMLYALKDLDKKGYRRVIFADSDIFFLTDVDDIFLTLDLFNFVAAHAPGRKTGIVKRNDPQLSTAIFPEFNGGLMGVYIPTGVALFEIAYELYSSRPDYYGNCDQPAIRDAILQRIRDNEEFRVYVLPPEYNMRFNQPCFVKGAVKVLHGHTDKPRVIEESVNKERRMRVWNKGKIVE